MKFTKNSLKSKIGRRRALALLGLAAAAAYATPVLLKLNSVAASSGASGAKKRGSSGGGKSGGSGGASGAGDLLATDPTTLAECSECHDAYSPRLLPSNSWRKVMGNLDNHFGEDASIDNATRLNIEKYLVDNAPRGGGPIRISELRWFRKEHRGNISLDKAKSWSNCTACHRQ